MGEPAELCHSVIGAHWEAAAWTTIPLVPGALTWTWNWGPRVVVPMAALPVTVRLPSTLRSAAKAGLAVAGAGLARPGQAGSGDGQPERFEELAVGQSGPGKLRHSRFLRESSAGSDVQ
ncbi:MAG: hypothetical protein HY331_11575 [Chloroflexi bacterium]|nr:hypothetical protein [Chloroflexota bacterium]